MKEYIKTALKGIGFMVLWLVLVVVTSFANELGIMQQNDAVLRLWLELLPLAAIVLATFVFIKGIERSAISVGFTKQPLRSMAAGILLGIVWITASVTIVYLTGNLYKGSSNQVSNLVIWITAVFINVTMQELLVRGYLFSLLKVKCGKLIAIAVTTALFTLMHGGIWEAGILPVLNVVLMSVFMSLLLLETENILAPIAAHFIWNCVGGIFLGCINLAEDYPVLQSVELTGSKFFTGGESGIEGSIAVFIINSILVLGMVWLRSRKMNRAEGGAAWPIS